MRIVKERITLIELKKLAKKGFGNMIKAVVDVNRGQMAIDGELHADEEALLLKDGSKQSDLWGINLYPEIEDKGWIEFDSMINLRPLAGNQTRSVGDSQVRKKIVKIVDKLIKK